MELQRRVELAEEWRILFVLSCRLGLVVPVILECGEFLFPLSSFRILSFCDSFCFPSSLHLIDISGELVT